MSAPADGPDADPIVDDLEAVTDAVLVSSRALVAVASRSIAAADDSITLPQFRALVVLDTNGGRCRVGELAHELRIQPSTCTRLCDRLVRRGFVARAVDPSSRREVVITLSAAGRRLVHEVTQRRRHEIATIMARVPSGQREAVVEALEAFRAAAGEELPGPMVPW